MSISKICTTCKIELPISEFWKRSAHKDGLMYTCKKCTAKRDHTYKIKHRDKWNRYLRLWNRRNPEKAKSHRKKYYTDHKKEVLKGCRDRYQALKKEIFAAYGGKCVCCGEAHFEFLSIDHIGGGGCRERKSLGAHDTFVLIKRLGFPKDRYRLLCYNCNMSLGFSGYCPHRADISP